MTTRSIDADTAAQLRFDVVKPLHLGDDGSSSRDLFDANWCPEHGHAPKTKAFERAAALLKLMAP